MRYLAASADQTITPAQSSLVEYEETFIAAHSQATPDATLFESLSKVLITAQLDPVSKLPFKMQTDDR